MTPRQPFMRRVLPSIPQSLTVFVFWLLMAEDYSPGNIVMALILAWLMPQLAARLEREFAQLGRLRGIGTLVGRLLWDILVANLTVAKQVLGPNHKLHSQFVWIPLDLTNIHGISALTSVITLTPGTVSAELSEDRKHLLIHCLSTDDPQALIAEIKHRYEAPLREVFPMITIAIVVGMHLVGIAMLLSLWRLLRGPTAPDRILALDTLYVSSIAQLILFGMLMNTEIYFEAALVIAMLGFVGTVVLSKYVIRRDIVE